MRLLRTAEILAIGSELLSPHRSDTNSLYLTAILNECGISIRARGIAGDDVAELAERLRFALSRADLIVTTGGLGPTDDDITREAIASVLGLPLEENAEILSVIAARFARRKMTMPEINRRQAQVPRGATSLPNPNGTAPGLWIENADRVIVLLPGPPREMQAMMESEVRPRLLERTGGRRLRRRVIKTTGWPESRVDEVAAPIYRTLRAGTEPVETTILAAPGAIELHLSAAGSDVDAIDRDLDAGVRAIGAALEEIVVSVDGRSLEEVVGAELKQRGLRVAVAESCTGGLMLGRLTNVPGSSSWVIGGVVAYDNTVKIDMLGVPAQVIASHGAVSEPVAQAMAEGVRDRFGADVGIGITGVAGPGGGTPTKPVGMVVISVAGAHTAVRTFNFVGDRGMVRTQAVNAALDVLRRSLGGRG